MNKCSILGHKRVRPDEPRYVGNYVESKVLDHCDRCKFVCGAWLWFNKHWAYFKR